jgi:O-acetyl-ADP-ribose deacetylase (regulator of RNase III)
MKKYKSIAFPVLATGTHSFPPERVAKIMVKAIEEFGEENPVHTFETVRIVIQPEDEQALQVSYIFDNI